MGRMRLALCLLVAIACVGARKDAGRAKKQPFVVDAVGNKLPPPSNVPATVGSPVNLLTPDRYEFYTFDESGELVKRLMTLKEIQAIVAAGEEAEGLVTFANDNQPTIAFNFSEPAHTKVHSVVTNVKNILEAQKQAYENNPVLFPVQPTLDTPDVSNSWSLILPTVFGDTGLEIIPDKSSAIATQPETDTFTFSHLDDLDESSVSKEGNNQILNSTTDNTEDVNAVPHAEDFVADKKTTPIPTTTTTTSTTTTTTTTTTQKPTTTSTTTTTTTMKPTTTKTPVKLTTKKETAVKITLTKRPPIKPTTVKDPVKFTTVRIPPAKLTTVKDVSNTTKQSVSTLILPTTSNEPNIPTTTSRPRTTSTTKLTTTTSMPTTTTKKNIRSTTKITTSRPFTIKTTKQPTTTAQNISETIINKIYVEDNSISPSLPEKTTPQYEKISTFIPISTAYITEKTTQKVQTSIPVSSIPSTTYSPIITTEKIRSTVSQKDQPAVTTYKPTTTSSVPTTNQNQDQDSTNSTTITTQSVSPSTTASSTEFVSISNSHLHDDDNKFILDNITGNDDKEVILPLFDVAQSISQIASDLGGNYMPIPTVSNIVDTTKLNGMDFESKESLDIEIPVENIGDINKKNVSGDNNDNFVKISTLDPNDKKITKPEETVSKNVSSLASENVENSTWSTLIPESTTIDPIMSEAMGDLLSQVVNLAPQPTIDSENFDNNKIVTTENINEMTTTENLSKTTTTFAPYEIVTETVIINEPSENDIPSLENRINDLNESINIESGDSNLNNTGKDENSKTINDTENHKSALLNKIEETLKIEENIKPSTISDKIESTTLNYVSSTEKYIRTSSLEPMTTEINTNSGGTDKTTKVDKIPELLPKIDDFKKKIQKVNIDDKELVNERNSSWKLISTVTPPKVNEIPKDKNINAAFHAGDGNSNKNIVLDVSKENQGLEVTTKDLSEDIAKFAELCNELAFRYWNAIVENIDKRRSFILSPYSITSMLAMMFMGARGSTSGEMNDILKLDDMVTFNPHFTLKNISDSIETTPESGVIVSAFIRELYSDKGKGKILTFYKERAQHFYNGHVEEINFKLISDIIRRRTNLLVKRYTWGKIAEYMKANSITMHPPLAAFSANIFQTDCTGSSVEGRDGEMYFVVSPNVRQRRLVPVPAVVYRSGFLAGYDPVLDATAAALGNTNSVVSTLFVMPGQQGNVVHAEDLEALEQRLLDANPTTPAWNRLLRTLLPRIGLELQIPRFSHKSLFNVSSTLRKMGLKDLFDAEHADLGGLNGPSKDLYLSDMIQSTTFVTCGEGVIGEQHHMEEYPETLGPVSRRRASRWAADWDEPRDYQRAFHDPHDVGEAMHLPLHLRPRQARLPARNAQPARLKFDRPFLYFVRHNPSGMILYVGRYNPRLLP